MGTAIVVILVAWFIYAVFKNMQEKSKHETLYRGDRTEQEIDTAQAQQRGRVKAKLTGAVIGAVVGSFLGIAAFGGPIAGTIPCALIGWWMSGRR